MMNSSTTTDQSHHSMKLIKLFLGIIAVSVLTLQPMAPANAFGPGPDPGPDLGPDPGPDPGPDLAPEPGPEIGPDLGPGR